MFAKEITASLGLRAVISFYYFSRWSWNHSVFCKPQSGLTKSICIHFPWATPHFWGKIQPSTVMVTPYQYHNIIRWILQTFCIVSRLTFPSKCSILKIQKALPIDGSPHYKTKDSRLHWKLRAAIFFYYFSRWSWNHSVFCKSQSGLTKSICIHFPWATPHFWGKIQPSTVMVTPYRYHNIIRWIWQTFCIVSRLTFPLKCSILKIQKALPIDGSPRVS
jgi:hypothetical protein